MSSNITLTPEEQSEKGEANDKVSTMIPVIEHKVKRRILLFGLALSKVCALFPMTAFAPALGLVALDMKDYKNISWYMTSFYLGSSIFQLLPIKISDCFGRRRLFLFGIIFMLIASLVACFSVNNYMLIVMRACQGMCCGILQTLSAVVIIDLFPLEKRIAYMSNNAVAFGVTSTVGPMIGGIIADKLSWRYIFAFTIILVIPVAVIVYFFVEIPTKPEQKISIENCKTICSRIDAGGCMIVAIGVVCFLLGMNFASTSRQYNWSSPIVIALLAGSFLSVVVLVIYERYVASIPLFPSVLVTNRNMVLMYIQQFINGCYFITASTMASVSFQSVFNDTPTKDSIKVIPATLTFITFIIIQSRITKKLRTPKPALTVGNLLVVPALLLMAFVQTQNSSASTQIGLLVFYAIGLGCVYQATNIASQLILEEVAPRMIASSTVIIRFLPQLGTAVMSAVFFSVMNLEVGTHLESLHQTDPSLFQRVIASGAYRDYVKIRTISDKQVQATLNSIYFKSISKIHYPLMGLCVVANICILLVRIPKMPEKKGKKMDSTDNQKQ